jgi:hypothetical protein
MRRLLALIITITSMALVCPVLAQPGPGAGPGTGRRAMRSAAQGTLMLIRNYNRQTVTTMKGVVESLSTLPPKSQAPGAISTAVLKTEQGNITVYLAPLSFLEEQKISLKAGDELEVTGSKVTLGQQPALIVKDLRVGGKSITLRDDGGMPVWMEAPVGGSPAK